MIDLILILAFVTTVSLLSLVGIAFVGLKEPFLRRILLALVGFSCGALIGGAFIHLLPEALSKAGEPIEAVLNYVVAGIIVFFVTEKFLYWRHCHEALAVIFHEIPPRNRRFRGSSIRRFQQMENACIQFCLCHHRSRWGPCNLLFSLLCTKCGGFPRAIRRWRLHIHSSNRPDAGTA